MSSLADSLGFLFGPWFRPVCEGYINKTVKKFVILIKKAASHRDTEHWEQFVIVNIVSKVHCVVFFVGFIQINILVVIVQTHLWLVVENCRQINGRANAQNYMWQRLEMSGSSFWTLRSAAACPSYGGFSTNWVVKWDRCWGLKRPW